jgi:hypothetical protein
MAVTLPSPVEKRNGAAGRGRVVTARVGVVVRPRGGASENTFVRLVGGLPPDQYCVTRSGGLPPRGR